MKNTILILAVTVCMAGTILTGCRSSVKKTDNTKDTLQVIKKDAADAESNLKEMSKDFISEYQQFKTESEEKINAYEKSIADYKVSIAHAKKEDKAKYEKELAGLEQKNSDLKKKLEDYKDEGQNKWTAFKNEFTHDMDELGKALKEFTVKNK